LLKKKSCGEGKRKTLNALQQNNPAGLKGGYRVLAYVRSRGRDIIETYKRNRCKEWEAGEITSTQING